MALAGLVAVLACAGPSAAQAPARTVTVFAAASLTNVLQEISETHDRNGGAKVKLSFAASSTLAKQIEAGAKAQVYVSADDAWMDYLDKRGMLAPGTRRAVAGNRLVVVIPANGAWTVPDAYVADLQIDHKWFLRGLQKGRIAIGDPAHVPAGRYAEQALRHIGIWDAVSPRLARADNVRGALVLVERGEADAGVVYATDAAASRQVRIAGGFREGAHSRIVYPAALLKGEDGGDARRFYDALFSPEARAVFLKHGFAMD